MTWFDWVRFVAGLGIFLFGMQLLEQALKVLSSESFRQLLLRSTRKPLLSVLGGTLTTMILQSSSLVGLMMMAFVGAGMIPLYNAVGVVLGANLGTTFTGWIVTTLGFKLKLDALAIPLMGVGAFWHVLAGEKARWQAWGSCVLGIGLILFGLDAMKTAMEQLAEQADVTLLQGYPLLIYLLVGAVFTALIRSSSAAMMIILSALHAGSIDLVMAAALAVGADMGTTSTMALGSIKGSAVKKQLALAHVLFNLMTTVAAFLLLRPLLYVVQQVYGVADPLYALVAFHSTFNAAGVILFLPFVKRFSTFLERRFVDLPTDLRLYINNVPFTQVEEAILAVSKEVERLLVQVVALTLRNLKVDIGAIALLPEQQEQLHQAFPTERVFMDCYSDLKQLEGEILEFAGKVQTQILTEIQVSRLHQLLNSARHGIYAAKSLKDVRENLMALRHADSGYLQAYYARQQEQEIRHLCELFQLLQQPPAEDEMRSALVRIRTCNKQSHHQVEDELFTSGLQLGVNELQISTLLNVNREFRTSIQNFARAVGLLRLPQR